MRMPCVESVKVLLDVTTASPAYAKTRKLRIRSNKTQPKLPNCTMIQKSMLPLRNLLEEDYEFLCRNSRPWQWCVAPMGNSLMCSSSIPPKEILGAIAAMRNPCCNLSASAVEIVIEFRVPDGVELAGSNLSTLQLHSCIS